MSSIQDHREMRGESWEEYCAREIREAQDRVRVCRGIIAIIPLIRAIPDLKNMDSMLSEMIIYDYDSARKVLFFGLEGHGGRDSVTPILRAFDTYSV